MISWLCLVAVDRARGRGEGGEQKLRMNDSWFAVQFLCHDMGIVNDALDENEECIINQDTLKGGEVPLTFYRLMPMAVVM